MGLGDWLQLLKLARLTTTQSVLVVTGAVSHQGVRAWILWDKCYLHATGAPADTYACAKEIGTAFLQWGIGLAAPDRLTGWYKRDENELFNIAGITALPIVDYNVGARLMKRDGDVSIDFRIGNETYQHVSRVYNYVPSENYTISLLGHSLTSGGSVSLLPLSVLETTGSQFVVTAMHPENRIIVRELMMITTWREQAQRYSIANMEEPSFVKAYNYILGFGQDRLSYAEDHDYNGYINRLKCAWKVYDDDEKWDTWSSRNV